MQLAFSYIFFSLYENIDNDRTTNEGKFNTMRNNKLSSMTMVQLPAMHTHAQFTLRNNNMRKQKIQ